MKMPTKRGFCLLFFPHRVTGNAYKTAFGDYIFCALRIMKDPPIEWFKSVFCRVLGSPSHQFRDPMILRVGPFLGDVSSDVQSNC